MYRETVEPRVVAWLVDVSTTEMDVVRVRSIRISSSWPVVAIVARAPQWTSIQSDVPAAYMSATDEDVEHFALRRYAQF